MLSRVFTILAFAMLACTLVFAGAAWAQAGQGQYDNDGITVEQTTTPETTNTADATTADFQNTDGLRAGDARFAEGFTCANIVDISQSSSRNQYNFSAARLQECLAREVIGETRGKLANTGGPSLLPIAAFLLIGAGLFVGRALVSRRGR